MDSDRISGDVIATIARRVGLALAIGIPATLAVGALYQGIASDGDLERFPPPGRMVDVGGRLMHIDCRGEGQPVIVLESAVVGDSLDWFKVHDRLAAQTRTCAYDRAGLGWSEPASTPRTSTDIAEDLGKLLTAAGEPGPYVLIGHAMGGVHVRAFHAADPARVAGVVLLDASHEDNLELMPPAILRLEEEWKERDAYCRWLQPLGFIRFAGVMRQAVLPPEIRGPAEAIAEQSHHCGARYRYADAAAENFRQASETPDLVSLPLLVITRGMPPRQEELPAGYNIGPFLRAFEIHTIMQQEHLMLSTDSRQVVARDSGHFIHWDQPQLVADEVSDLLAQIRGSEDLSGGRRR